MAIQPIQDCKIDFQLSLNYCWQTKREIIVARRGALSLSVAHHVSDQPGGLEGVIIGFYENEGCPPAGTEGSRNNRRAFFLAGAVTIHATSAPSCDPQPLPHRPAPAIERPACFCANPEPNQSDGSLFALRDIFCVIKEKLIVGSSIITHRQGDQLGSSAQSAAGRSRSQKLYYSAADVMITLNRYSPRS